MKSIRESTLLRQKASKRLSENSTSSMSRGLVSYEGSVEEISKHGFREIARRFAETPNCLSERRQPS
jgi:hypothetical protein